MLVLSMSSKRQRRPNVRLGEVGDVPAAFACGFSHTNNQILGHKTYENDLLLNPNDTKQAHIYGFGLGTKSSADLLQNRENNDPNSSKSVFEVVNSDHMDMDMAKLKLNFGTITRKCRVMKRRSRITNMANDVFNHVWSSKVSSEDRKDCDLKDFVRFSSDEFNDHFPEDSPDHETSSAMSKEALRFDGEEPTKDVGQRGNSDELWLDDVSDEGNNMSPPVSDHVWNEMNSGGSDVKIVSRWLEEKGFGKYADLFEMHEVDEEALPLLTLEDLKEIGVFAVGSRRKLYTAIQQLRRSDVCTDNTSK